MIPVRQTIFGADGNCLRAAVASIVECEIDDVINVLSPEMEEAAWFDNLVAWGDKHGWKIEAVAPDEKPEGYSIAVGRTSRSPDLHAVIAQNGHLHFDPHPSDMMLDFIKYFVVITATVEQRAAP